MRQVSVSESIVRASRVRRWEQQQQRKGRIAAAHQLRTQALSELEAERIARAQDRTARTQTQATLMILGGLTVCGFNIGIVYGFRMLADGMFPLPSHPDLSVSGPNWSLVVAGCACVLGACMFGWSVWKFIRGTLAEPASGDRPATNIVSGSGT